MASESVISEHHLRGQRIEKDTSLPHLVCKPLHPFFFAWRGMKMAHTLEVENTLRRCVNQVNIEAAHYDRGALYVKAVGAEGKV